MKKAKKVLFVIMGLFFIGLAYIGIFIPGLPTTFFAIIASWFFVKSSDRLNNWVINHPIIGKHISNWKEKRIYPKRGKYAMIGCMITSLVFSSFFLELNVILYMFVTFAIIIGWALRYPSSEEEYNERVRLNKKIGWIK